MYLFNLLKKTIITNIRINIFHKLYFVHIRKIQSYLRTGYNFGTENYNMVSEDELMKVLKRSLEEKGQYGRLKADLQYQLMLALGLDKQLISDDKPQPSLSITLLNQLIQEYLVWCGYSFSETVFSAEASISAAKPSREEICKQLNVKDSPSSSQLPLLLSVLTTVKGENTGDKN